MSIDVCNGCKKPTFRCECPEIVVVLRREVAMLQATCEEHIRIRNEMGDRVSSLEHALRYAAECPTLAMVRDTARGMGVVELTADHLEPAGAGRVPAFQGG